MRVKLFVEPREKAREEVLLESSVPTDMKIFKQWQKSWVSSKDFKKWKKATWESQILGVLREGKIVSSATRAPDDEFPLKGKLLAYRSFIIDATGVKCKLPMVLFAQIKKTIGLSYFQARMELDKDQENAIKDALKTDPWAPIAVWHPQPVDRNHEIAISDVLPHAINYARALFEYKMKDGDWSTFVETEQFK